MWALMGFERGGERLVAEYPLPGAEVNELRALLGRPTHDQMYGDHPVSDEVIAELRRMVGDDSIAAADADYFLTFWADEE